MPFSPLHLLAALLFIGLLITFIHLGALTIAFEKLGLVEDSAFTLLLVSLFGSAVNLPLFRIKTTPPEGVTGQLPRGRGLLRLRVPPFTGQTLIAINVGGGLVPVLFSVYLLRHTGIDPWAVVLATAGVAAISFLLSRPIPGLGIGMPVFVAPISAALLSVLLGGEHSAALAYISGTLGVLIGADILRLRDIQRLGAPVAAIGGAGTFDGIFITGIVAVLLA